MKSVQIRSFFSSPFSRILAACEKIRTRGNSVSGHFAHSASFVDWRNFTEVKTFGKNHYSFSLFWVKKRSWKSWTFWSCLLLEQVNLKSIFIRTFFFSYRLHVKCRRFFCLSYTKYIIFSSTLPKRIPFWSK